MQIKLDYKPHNKQRMIHEACSSSSNFKYITVVAGRQSGKSRGAAMQLIKWAFEKPNQTIWVVSPSSSQATKFYKGILNPLEKSGLIKSATASKGDIKIELLNDTIIEFKSILAKDTLRGQTLDYLILDEAAFMDEETIDEVLLPMILTKPKAKVLITTTPKGKNWIYKWFSRGLEGNSKYKSIRFTSKDNPLADIEAIEGWKSSMPSKRFEQEILAEFVDAATVFSNINELIYTPTGTTENYYAGIDIAMKNDYTVVSILDDNGYMVAMDRFTDVDVTTLVNRVYDFLSKYKIKKTYIELNNQGLPVFNLLQEKLYSKIEGFNTTATSKPEIINKLIAAFSIKEIRIIDNEILKNELESFEEKYTHTGKVTFSAPSGMHDDTVMSLAIAWECYNKNKHSYIAIEF